MSLRKCTVKIPKSGKKLINLGGIDFFVREAKGLVEIFLQDSGDCILVSGNSRQVALRQLTERLSDVREYIKRREGSSL